MDVVPPLVADREPTVFGKPRQCALHHPPVSSQLLAALYAFPGYAALDAALSQSPFALLVVVGFVGVQLLRTLPRPATWALPRGRFMGSMASTSSSKTIESCTLAALVITASGMPLRSETRWRFEPAFPYLLDSCRFSRPPFCRDARRV